jgi:hypothetical protein
MRGKRPLAGVAGEADRDEPRRAEAARARRVGKPRRSSSQEYIGGRRIETRSATKSATRPHRLAPAQPGMRAPLQANETSPGNSTGPTKPTTTRTISAAVKALFRDAAKAITRANEDKPPPPARRRGEAEKGFIMAVRRRYDRLRETHRAVTRGGSGSGRAFGEAANAALLAAQMPEDLSHAGGGYGDHLFDPASAYWQGNYVNNDQWHSEDFSAKQDQYFPQP